MHQRRRFLKVLCGTAVISGVQTACSEDEPSTSQTGGSGGAGASTASNFGGYGAYGGFDASGGNPGLMPFNAGSVDDIAEGELVPFLTEAIIVARDAAGIYAMSSICTHEQCDTLIEGTITATAIRCGCHGSRYDLNGEVTSGPAESTLDHLRVTINADREILVNRFAFVDKDERTPVP